MGEGPPQIRALKNKLNSKYKEKINNGTTYFTIEELISRYEILEVSFAEDSKAPSSKDNNRSKGNNNNGSSTGNRGSKAPKDMSGLLNLPNRYKNIKKLDDAKRERYKKGGLYRRYRRSSHIIFKENKYKLAK